MVINISFKNIKKNFPDSYFIAVMSGNFTQRGEITLVDKWQRAKLAVANGIDFSH